MPNGAIHILIIDDHAVVAETIAAYLSTVAGMRVSVASSVPQALAITEVAEDLRLVLIDLHMPEMSGFQGLRRIRDLRPDLSVAILSGDESPAAVRAALNSGASGYIPKTMSAPAVLAAVQMILAGTRYAPDPRLEATGNPADTLAFSKREREVLDSVVAGRSNKEVAMTLGIVPGTVALHLTNIYRKLGAKSRSQAIRRAFDLGIYADRRDFQA